MRRPLISECDKKNPDHWCIVIEEEDEVYYSEEDPHTAQCPQCGGSPDDKKGKTGPHVVDMKNLKWQCGGVDCGLIRPIVPHSIEVEGSKP